MLDFFNHATALAALAVVLVQQLLKFNFVPVGFVNRHPVPALIVFSTIASAIVVWLNAVAPHTVTDWILLVATVAVTAAIVYNSTIRNWAALRAAEGPGDSKPAAPVATTNTGQAV